MIAVACAAQPYDEKRPPVMPDAKISPGEVADNGATVEQVLKVGYTATVRNVPESRKHEVFVRYFGHVPTHPGEFEIDHIISCELNGSQSVSNLFPMTYDPKEVWNARTKDRLENFLAAECRKALKQGHAAGEARLKLAQYEISHDWTNAFVKYLGQPDAKKNTHGKAIE